MEKETGEFEDVSSLTLDDFCKNNNINHIDILKIDVEGHELKVLKGLSNMLDQQKVNHLFVEINEGNLRITGTSASELCSFLHGCGYHSYSIKTGARLKYQIGDDESLVYFTLPDNEIHKLPST